MVHLQHTSLREIEKNHATLWKTFSSGTCRPLEYRRQQLYQVARMVQENADAFAEAINKDVKPKTEAFVFELGGVVDRALRSAESLEEWSKPEKVEVPDWQKPWNPTLYKSPKGAVLVIAPWNYPMILSLQPLIAAIAAGCPAAVKPSEVSPNYSQLLAELLPKYLDQQSYVVVNGGIVETTKLLDLKWAHIFYTGNGRVGRVIASAAAKHLTPVSLELGGKSPVIVDPEYDISLAAKRILFGKSSNAGQTCVAPDFVLIPREKQGELVEAFRRHISEIHPEGSLASSSYGHIVNKTHFDRINDLIARTNGKVEVGGKSDVDSLKIDLTIVSDTSGDDPLMQEEIFGPILPIVPVADLDEAMEYVNSHDNPLAFYVFTERPEIKQKLIDGTLSGSIIFNDTMQQLAVNELPFSGVGEAGYGYQIMKYGFDGFTHIRSSIDMPKEAEPHLAVRYAPYTEEKHKILSAAVYQPIPAVANGHI